MLAMSPAIRVWTLWQEGGVLVSDQHPRALLVHVRRYRWLPPRWQVTTCLQIQESKQATRGRFGSSDERRKQSLQNTYMVAEHKSPASVLSCSLASSHGGGD